MFLDFESNEILMVTYKKKKKRAIYANNVARRLKIHSVFAKIRSYIFLLFICSVASDLLRF